MRRMPVRFVSRKATRARRCRAGREAAFSLHAAPDRNDGRKSGLAAASQLFRGFVALCETKNPDLPGPNEAPGPNNLLCDLCANLPISRRKAAFDNRSEEHTSELQSLMRRSYAAFC